MDSNTIFYIWLSGSIVVFCIGAFVVGRLKENVLHEDDIHTVVLLSAFWPLITAVVIAIGPFVLMFKLFEYMGRQSKINSIRHS